MSVLATALGGGQIVMWDIADLSDITPFDERFLGHLGPATSVTFSADGSVMASGSVDATTLLWSLGARPNAPARIRYQTEATDQPAVWATFTSDERSLFTGRSNGSVERWSVGDDAQLTMTSATAADGVAIIGGDLARDRPAMATVSSDGRLRLWDVTGSLDAARPVHITEGSTAVAITPDGLTVLSGHDDGRGTVWDVTDPVEPREVGAVAAVPGQAVSTMALSDDGHQLFVGGDAGDVVRVDVADRAQPTPGPPARLPQQVVRSMVIAPNGATLATGSNDNQVVLWDVADTAAGEYLGVLAGQDPAIGPGTLAAAPGRQLLARTVSNGQVLISDFSNLQGARKSLNERACHLAGGGLTPDEWAAFIPTVAFESTCDDA